MSNNVEKLWDLYKDILSIESVRQHLVLPSNYCNESTLALIPSLEASTAGVRVRSIFMITENYLCEIRTQTENDFDIALKKIGHQHSHFNVRYARREKELPCINSAKSR